MAQSRQILKTLKKLEKTSKTKAQVKIPNAWHCKTHEKAHNIYEKNSRENQEKMKRKSRRDFKNHKKIKDEKIGHKITKICTTKSNKKKQQNIQQ